MTENYQFHALVAHRNGICGLGFYAVSFSFTEEGKQEHAIATVDYEDVEHVKNGTPHDPATRILMMGPTGIDITRTMRGDHFHEALCKYITVANQKERESWHTGKKKG